MKIIGIGIDIEEIKRFEKFEKGNLDFFNKVFTRDEIEYCFSQNPVTPHLAGRFAAKEAIIKALGSVEKEIGRYHDIEIINTQNGAPMVKLKNRKNYGEIKLSLSHSELVAVAVAIVYDYQE